MSVKKICYEDYVDDDPFEFLTCSFSALTSPTVSCNHQYLMISITSKVFIDFFCVQIFDYNKYVSIAVKLSFKIQQKPKKYFQWPYLSHVWHPLYCYQPNAHKPENVQDLFTDFFSSRLLMSILIWNSFDIC